MTPLATKAQEALWDSIVPNSFPGCLEAHEYPVEFVSHLVHVVGIVEPSEIETRLFQRLLPKIQAVILLAGLAPQVFENAILFIGFVIQ